jgi:hypothetical protein
MAITALMVGPLRGKPVMITNANPTMGDINIYNTLDAGTPLTMTLPQLGVGVQTAGAIMLLGKDPNDTSSNTLTFLCYAGDAFADGSTSLVIPNAGMQRTLEIVSISGALRWQTIGGLDGATSTAPADVDTDEQSDENPYDYSVPNALTDPASDVTRFGEQLPTGTGYGGYGDGAYGYGQ